MSDTGDNLSVTLKKIFIITPFPEMVEAVLGESILRRAAEKKIVEYHIINLRDYATGKFKQIDDYPFGGGTGMIMMPEPIMKAMDRVKEIDTSASNMSVIFPTPQGEQLTQEKSWKLSRSETLVFISGHYKGMDERIRESIITDEISIGDYVLTNGELPTLVILDTVVRLIPGVLGDEESANSDSFTNELLDHPHYTRPAEVRGLQVPEVLLSGHHSRIEEWRLKQREKRTRSRRPDLWKAYKGKQTS